MCLCVGFINIPCGRRRKGGRSSFLPLSHVHKSEMDSSGSKSKKLKNSNSSQNDEPASENNEFNGFKDVDAFVKVK